MPWPAQPRRRPVRVVLPVSLLFVPGVKHPACADAGAQSWSLFTRQLPVATGHTTLVTSHVTPHSPLAETVAGF